MDSALLPLTGERDTARRLTIRVPWQAVPVQIGCGFDSSTTSFKLGKTALKDATLGFMADSNEGACSQSSTSMSQSYADHMDLQFSGSVGNSFAGGSAQGSYFKDIKKDGNVRRFWQRRSELTISSPHVFLRVVVFALE